MKTKLDLPDELMRAARTRAAKENLELNEVVANLLRLGLTAASPKKRMVRKRVQFPLVGCAHPAKAGDELTPERVADILADGEVSDLGVVR